LAGAGAGLIAETLAGVLVLVAQVLGALARLAGAGLAATHRLRRMGGEGGALAGVRRLAGAAGREVRGRDGVRAAALGARLVALLVVAGLGIHVSLLASLAGLSFAF